MSKRYVARAYGVHTFGGNVGWALAPMTVIGLAALVGWHAALIAIGCCGVLMAALVLLAGGVLLRGHPAASREDDADASVLKALSLLFSPAIVLCFVYFALLSVALVGVQTFLPATLQALRGIDVTTASVILTAYLGGSAAGILAGVEFHASRAATSALFSLTGFAFYMIGPFAGYLGDRCGPRIMAGLGAAVMGTSLVPTGFISQMWVGYITYGIGVGLGAACAYVPTLAIVGGWFVEHRGTALGVGAAGTGCGTLLMPPLIAWLIARCGWRVTDMVIGTASALLLAGCALVVRAPPLMHAASAHHSLRRVVCSYPFIVLYISWTLATTALFVPLVYLPAFAARGGAREVAASALLSLIGGMSVLGRAGLSGLGDRIGITRLFKMSVLVMAASYLLWLGLPSYNGLVIFATVLGLGYGVRIALMPGVLIEFFGLRHLGTTLGAFFTASGIAAVLGPLLAGWIVDRSGTYEWGIVFALVAGSLGFLAVVPLKIDPTSRHDPAVDGPVS